MNYYAHTAEDENGSPLPESLGKWQRLNAHLSNVAELAKRFAIPLGLQEETQLAGLLHDLGKYSQRFQERLRNPSIHGINHWSVGAFQAWELGRVSAALAIEGHHTGIPALKRNCGLECWAERHRKLRTRADAASVNGFSESLPDLLKRLSDDGFELPATIPKDKAVDREFAAAMGIRMLFSCLVDADFLDTEKHFDAAQSAKRIAPPLNETEALQILLAHIRSKPAGGAVNQLRQRLLSDCLAAAEKHPGLFTLTAPTGSGKTLASLAFALSHINLHNRALQPNDFRRLRRIIVVIPYTTIIEQTASIYRSVFEKEFGPDYVLEHHSAIGPCERKEDASHDAEQERLRRARLASENWDAPVVVTTSVRFFESVFSNRPSDCRKLHNIARSVVLFDEVQTLPRDRVPSLLSAVRLLAQEPSGSTAVFMTATQPAFSVADKLIVDGWKPTEISSNPQSMAEALKRVEIKLKPDKWRPTWEEVANELHAERQCLVVVNTKSAAQMLFKALPQDGNTFHLSTALCPAHRQAKLAEIRRRLDPKINIPCRLVSTQLIEAGVDLDFPVVWRALGPLDSIVQTAGRCNREGRLPNPGQVTVFRPTEDVMPRGAFRQAAAVTELFLAQRPGAQLDQPDTYSDYFRQLYGVSGPQKPEDDPLFKACKEFDFPAAADACRLVGDETRGVIVPWGDGETLIANIRAQCHCDAALLRMCQRFTVNLYLGEFAKAEREGVIKEIVSDCGVFEWKSKYDEHLGATHHTAEDLIL